MQTILSLQSIHIMADGTIWLVVTDERQCITMALNVSKDAMKPARVITKIILPSKHLNGHWAKYGHIFHVGPEVSY